MDIIIKIHLIFSVILKLIHLFYCLDLYTQQTKFYSLTRDCRISDERISTNVLTTTSKMHLFLNLTGALLTSHGDDSLVVGGGAGDGGGRDNKLPSDQPSVLNRYPDNFLCEVVAEAPAHSRIMLQIKSFYIPANNQLCDDNYLYVFDYSSSRSKAMNVAGGERGLCNSEYPNFPIFTTGPYITIVFKSTLGKIHIQQKPGFQLMLTQITPIDYKSECSHNQFECGLIRWTRQSGLPLNTVSVTRRQQHQQARDSVALVTSSSRSHDNTESSTQVNSVARYCIPRSLICDSIPNCHDGADETDRANILCNTPQSQDLGGVLTRFLSLGLSAAIAIAVSMIIAITFCIAVTVCYCMRICTGSGGIHCNTSTNPHMIHHASNGNGTPGGAAGLLCGTYGQFPGRFTKGVLEGSTTLSNENSTNTALLGSPQHHFNHPYRATNGTSSGVQNPHGLQQFGCIRGTSPSNLVDSDGLFRLYGSSGVPIQNGTDSQQLNSTTNITEYTNIGGVSSMVALPPTHHHPSTNNNGRPASEKLCHWTSSSLVSYPSSADGHHSHPETPYFHRDNSSQFYESSTTNTAGGSPHNYPPGVPSPPTASTTPVATGHHSRHHAHYPHHHQHHHQHHHHHNRQQNIVHTPSSSRSAKSTRSTKSGVAQPNSNTTDKKPLSSSAKLPISQQDRIRMLGTVLGEL